MNTELMSMDNSMNVEKLLFFNDLCRDSIIRTVQLAVSSPDLRESRAAYYEAERLILCKIPDKGAEGTIWQNHLFHRISESENLFSLAAERGEAEDFMLKIAADEITELRKLIYADWEAISHKVHDDRKCVMNMDIPEDIQTDSRLSELRDAIINGTPEKAAIKLAEYYRKNYCGHLGKFRAFVWDGDIIPILNPDPITFDDLIGYDYQQRQLITNTQAFMEGKRANNVLLYGDKGTGKSSSVKALLNMFGNRGLRLINLPKDKMFDITKIMKRVSDRAIRCIIFIDDLSFEESESEYKHFKSVLEGGVEVQPENVLVYVTSNRRNLVKEMWSDRGDDGEIHVGDGIQERQSLADRFGLTITFSAPDKELYSEIVVSIAEREGIIEDREKLLEEANKWDMRQTSRSGRSARQFITNYSAMNGIEQ